MEQIKLNRSKRLALPYIVNLECECGGVFIKIEPIEFDIQNNLIANQCNNCKKIIYCKDAYPISIMISDAEKTYHDTIEAYKK